MIGVDANVLTLLLNENSDAPPDPRTAKPVERVKERVEFLVQTLHKSKQKIIIPTPVLSEVLVRAGAAGLRYVEMLQKASVFEIRDFNTIAAVELALMTEQEIKAGDKRSGRSEPYQKIKLDRQIAAICKVAGVRTVYCADGSLKAFCEKAGMAVVGVHDLPLPPESPQLSMDELFAKSSEGETDEPKPEEIEIDEPDQEEEGGPEPS